MSQQGSISRRRLLGVGALSFGVAACDDASGGVSGTSSGSRPDFVGAHDAVVAAVEKARPHAVCGAARHVLEPARREVDLAGTVVNTWTYGPTTAGPVLRAVAGQELVVRLHNRLPAESTVHWHGIRIRSDMDGVSPVTQAPVSPGASFTYRFDVADPGTYWYHPHVGIQADRGLVGALVVEDPADRSGVDLDHVLVIDDWLDGLGTTPDAVLAALNPALDGMSGMDMSGDGADTSEQTSSQHAMAKTTTVSRAERRVARGLIMRNPPVSAPLGGVGGDVAHPMHLINGRPPADREALHVRAGGRIRLRLVNAAAETPYRVAVGGHRMTVTHTDGYAVEPFEVDTLIIGMAERYDVEVTVASGVWPIVAKAEGKPGHAAAVIRTVDAMRAQAPSPNVLPAELDGQLLAYRDLRPAAQARLAERTPDRDYRIDLVGSMDSFLWGIAGEDAAHLVVRQGERARIAITNTTKMWHPMHLHGHTFGVLEGQGIRKDTVGVLPGETVTIDFDADNPGPWMLHCHNAYHFEAGMTTNLNYLA